MQNVVGTSMTSINIFFTTTNEHGPTRVPFNVFKPPFTPSGPLLQPKSITIITIIVKQTHLKTARESSSLDSIRNLP